MTPPPYEEVAAIVAEWPSPAGYGPFIANRYGVPITTARRWINRCRRLGLLPSGTEDRPCPTCAGSGTVRWVGKTKTEAGGGG